MLISKLRDSDNDNGGILLTSMCAGISEVHDRELNKQYC